MSVHAPGSEIEMTSLSKRGARSEFNSDFNAPVTRPNIGRHVSADPGDEHVPSSMMAASEHLAPEPPAAKKPGFLSSLGSMFSSAASSVGNFLGGIGSSIKGFFGGGTPKKAASPPHDEGIEMTAMGASKAKPTPAAKRAAGVQALKDSEPFYVPPLEMSPVMATTKHTKDSVQAMADAQMKDAHERLRTGDSLVSKAAVGAGDLAESVREGQHQRKAEGEAAFGKYGNAAKDFAVNQTIKHVSGIDTQQVEGHMLNGAKAAKYAAGRSEDGVVAARQLTENRLIDANLNRVQAHKDYKAAPLLGAQGKFASAARMFAADSKTIKAQALHQANSIAAGTMGSTGVDAATAQEQQHITSGRANAPITFGEKAAHALTQVGDAAGTSAMILRGNEGHIEKHLDKSIAEGTSLAPTVAATTSGLTQQAASTAAHYMSAGTSTALQGAAEMTSNVIGATQAGSLVSDAASSLLPTSTITQANAMHNAKKIQQDAHSSGQARLAAPIRGLFDKSPSEHDDSPTAMQRLGSGAAVAMDNPLGRQLKDKAIDYGSAQASHAASAGKNLLEHLF